MKTILFFNLLLALYIIINTAIFHYHLITFDHPQEFRENAIYLTTNLLLKNENPYSSEQMPIFTNAYGIGYHLVVYPFAKLVGNSFSLHRLISSIFIFLSVVIVYLFQRQLKISAPLALLSCSLFYAELVLKGFTALARPDSLGLFLFLASLFIPYRLKYTNPSLAISLGLSLFAFLTKPYFVLGFLYLSFYLFIFVSKLRGLSYLITGVLSLGGLSFIIHLLFPTYFYNTVLINLGVASTDVNHLLNQTADFISWNFSTVIILLASILLWLLNSRFYFSHIKLGLISKLINLKFRSKPFFNLQINITTFALITSTFLIVAKLGLHVGSYMDYITQLLTPFFFLLTFSLYTKVKEVSLKIIFGLVISLNLLFWTQPALYQITSLERRNQSWQRLEQLVANYRTIYNSALIATSMEQQGKKVYTTGQTEFFFGGLNLNSKLGLFREAHQRFWDFSKDTSEKIINKKFDLIVIGSFDFTPLPKDELTRYYEIKAVLPLYTNTAMYQLYILEPKK